MKIIIAWGIVVFILIQELHTKSTPFNEMSMVSRNLRVTEIKLLLSNYIGCKQRCNDFVDKFAETANGLNKNDFDFDRTGVLVVTTIFASKTNTSESDWERIISGDKTLLTDDELILINAIPKTDDEDLEKMLKILAKSRMNDEDSTHVIKILNYCSDKSSMDKKIQGGLKAIITVIAACSGQSYEQVLSWFPEYFKRLHSTDRLYENLAGDNEKFI